MKKEVLRKIAGILVSVVLVLGAGCGMDADVDTEQETAPAVPTIGSVAPDFTLPGVDGDMVSLYDYLGNYVVLEWLNYDCPFVVKHYETNNMQQLQDDYLDKGVVWLGINSSAPGRQGHFSPEEWKELADERDTNPTKILLDTEGFVGRRYRARTTPEMFVIDPDGILIYMGAIDDTATTDHEDVKTAKNYVRNALESDMSGESVEPAVTEPYGCSVKYATE